jgi:hypothetical protein
VRRTFGGVAQFLVELYVSRTDVEGAERSIGRARSAADELTREGTPVRCLRSILVPDDETCFVLCEAGSVDDVHEAARRAALRLERVAAAVTPASGAGARSCP